MRVTPRLSFTATLASSGSTPERRSRARSGPRASTTSVEAMRRGAARVAPPSTFRTIAGRNARRRSIAPSA